MRSRNECAARNPIYVGTADAIFVLQIYLCLSTITEVPCVDTVAWIRPLQTAVRGPPNLQNTKTCAFLRTGFCSCVIRQYSGSLLWPLAVSARYGKGSLLPVLPRYRGEVLCATYLIDRSDVVAQ